MDLRGINYVFHPVPEGVDCLICDCVYLLHDSEFPDNKHLSRILIEKDILNFVATENIRCRLLVGEDLRLLVA